MTFAGFLQDLFDVYVTFFDSDFFRIFGLGFFGFFCLILTVKVVWYIVRFNTKHY